jgi:hypothetical protein
VTEALLVFVNERAVRVPPGATAEDAVAAMEPALADRLREGAAYLTDGRGIRLPPGEAVHAGAIVRVVVSARHGETRGEADAHP